MFQKKEVIFYMFNNNQNDNFVDNVLSKTWRNEAEIDEAVRESLPKVFFRMFIALVITAVTSWAVYQYALADPENISDSFFMVFIASAVVQLILVFYISFRINKMAASTANILFVIYSVLMGVTISTIFVIYDLGVIFQAFIISGIMFAATAGIGATTKRDLSKMGGYLLMGLIGIIIASIVTFFLPDEMRTTLNIAINYIAVFIFIGLTAYNTQLTKKMLRVAHESSQEEAIKRVTVMSALMLYINFINLFLRILAILGRRR